MAYIKFRSHPTQILNLTKSNTCFTEKINKNRRNHRLLPLHKGDNNSKELHLHKSDRVTSPDVVHTFEQK